MNTRSPQYDPYAGQQAYQSRHAPAPAPRHELPPSPAPVAEVRKPRRWPWVVGIVVAFLVGTGVGGAGDRTAPSSSSSSLPAAPAQAAPQQPAVVEEAAQAPVAGTISDGTYHVGDDLEPGRYKTAGPDSSSIVPMCYWARLKNDSGEFSAIIANENLQGPGSVTLKSGEFVNFSGGCTWTKQ